MVGATLNLVLALIIWENLPRTTASGAPRFARGRSTN